jgi:hypothetical protein
MDNEIKLVRLTSGEELITRLAKTTEGDWVAKDITVLIPTQSNSLGLAPFMPYTKITEEGVTLRDKDIMFITEPVEELTARYNEIHGNIVTPPSKKIII